MVRRLTEKRVELGLTFVQIDQIANAIVGEPERVCGYTHSHTRDWCGHSSCTPSALSPEAEEDDHMADMISDRWDDKHLG